MVGTAAPSGTIAENSANGTQVLRVSGIDRDPNNTMTYTLTGSAGGRFAIDANTGIVTVANSSLLDFETATNHSITVRATDQGGLTFDKVFTVNLTNVNEAPTALTLTGATTGAGSSAVYNASTDSYYTRVATALSWEAAMDNAQASSLNGVSGTLAVIDSAAEQSYLWSLSPTDNWIGASDKDNEGVWRWFNGDTAGSQFWTGAISGSAVGGLYANWSSGGEPNGGTNENYAHIRTGDGSWNDNSVPAMAGSWVEWTGVAFRAAQGVAGSVMENAAAGTVVGTLAATMLTQVSRTRTLW